MTGMYKTHETMITRQFFCEFASVAGFVSKGMWA